MSIGSDDVANMDLDERDGQAPQEQEDANSDGGESLEEDGEQRDEDGPPEEVANLNEMAFEIDATRFDQLHLPPAVQAGLKASWSQFLESASSRDAAGEALYLALLESAPTLQSLFTTPRPVMAVRFRQGIDSIVKHVDNPPELKQVVETLGFSHLNLEVTVPRVGIFRDAICDLLAVELGETFTTEMREAWRIVLNYAGGAFIYVRTTYSERFSILASSWATANQKEVEITDVPELDATMSLHKEGAGGGDEKKTKKEGEEAQAGAGAAATEGTILGGNTTVPKTFHDMFLFNAVVMGFGDATWMVDVLESFDNLVKSMSSANRMQEECDILSLCISKTKYRGAIALPQFKSVMLATLRSLVPKDWDGAHEVAWGWLWENVERMIKVNMGKPAVMEKGLERMLSKLTDDERHVMRTSIFETLFSRYPAAQDVFKQSTTRLHFIVDRAVAMTLEVFKEPKKMTEDLSALGLRHVGYGVRTDLFAPFVTACVDVLRSIVENDEAGEEGFRWSISLISRILVRVINEGSTIVMRAINANSGKQLKEAVTCAPRGERAMWVLKVQVGTQSISPLQWAIENSNLDAAEAILDDLLTIRADRDRYYYGMESMFERHPDIVRKLASEAPKLLPFFLDGLIWRSRTTEPSGRRVNYYVQHLMVGKDGSCSPFVQTIAEHSDPKVACHPVVVLVTDLIWMRVAIRTFLMNRSWFAFTLALFIASQAIVHEFMVHSQGERVLIAVLRAFIYTACMGQRIFQHARRSIKEVKAGQVVRWGRLSLPEHFTNLQDRVSIGLCLALVGMLLTEPILHCISDPNGVDVEKEAGVFTQHCHGGEVVLTKYQCFSMIAMLLYFALLIDLSVLSTSVSAFVLVCSRLLTELWLFLFAMFFTTVAFAAAMAAEANELDDWKNMGKCFLSFMEIVFRVYDKQEAAALMEEPFAFLCVLSYCVIVLISAINLLVAQLNCAYTSTYEDMVGFARLNRAFVLVEVMPSVPRWRWDRFVKSMQFDRRCEFGVGDVGMPGGIQVFEPASLHPTTVDRIRRYGGSTAVESPWPADESSSKDDDEERLARLEKALEKIMRKVTRGGGRRGRGTSSMGGSGSSWRSGSAGESATHSSVSSGSAAGSMTGA